MSFNSLLFYTKEFEIQYLFTYSSLIPLSLPLTPYLLLLLIRMFIIVHIFNIDPLFFHGTPCDKDID